jgi:hypothetical protein
MIFKIQRPIISTKGQPYLIYNEDRSIMTDSLEVGQNPDIDKLFGKGEYKIYAKGYISKNGKDLVINRKVTGQDW